MLNMQSEELKPLLKEVLHELLIQERGWLVDLVYEVMEDVAMAKAIAVDKDCENVSRDEIYRYFP
jgi:hypothetical protein